MTCRVMRRWPRPADALRPGEPLDPETPCAICKHGLDVHVDEHGIDAGCTLPGCACDGFTAF